MEEAARRSCIDQNHRSKSLQIRLRISNLPIDAFLPSLRISIACDAKWTTIVIHGRKVVSSKRLIRTASACYVRYCLLSMPPSLHVPISPRCRYVASESESRISRTVSRPVIKQGSIAAAHPRQPGRDHPSIHPWTIPLKQLIPYLHHPFKQLIYPGLTPSPWRRAVSPSRRYPASFPRD
jgi:hypothetical protein